MVLARSALASAGRVVTDLAAAHGVSELQVVGGAHSPQELIDEIRALRWEPAAALRERRRGESSGVLRWIVTDAGPLSNLRPGDQLARRLQTGDRALINELHQRSLHLAGLIPDLDRHRLRE
jgi:hypothetical protein